MAKTITIRSGKQVISIESDDAGVPDVTKDAGPDLMQLQNDAMASPNEENAEFNAAVDDSPVESEDKTQDVNKANESLFASIFGLEDGEEATATGDEPASEPDQSDTPVTPPAAETPAETPAEEPASDGDGAGEVSEADGVTTIDTGDTIITISSSDDAAETPAEEPAAETPAETPAEEPAATENAPAEPEQNTDQAIESFFKNLGL